MITPTISILKKAWTSPVFQDVAWSVASRILPGVASLISVPILLHVLGAERYGAIGLFLTIQGLCGLLDIGLGIGAARQAAWLSGQNAPPEKFSSLLRSFEIPYFSIAALIALIGTLAGAAILRTAFHIDLSHLGLGPAEVFLIFAAIGSRFPFGLYSGYLSGRGQIKRANIIQLVSELCRIIGALFLVLVIGPLLSIFFGWYLLVAAAAATVAYFAAWQITPSGASRVTPDWSELFELRSVMIGSGNIAALFILTNTLDKLFLPRFVSPADFGLYVATGQLALALFMIVQPIVAAFQPRLLSAFATDDFASARRSFLTAAGLISAICCACIVGVIIGTPAILKLWIGAAEPRFVVVLIALCAGFGLAGLTQLPLTVHQASTRYFPIPLIFAATIIGIPSAAYLALDRIDVSAVALILLAIYVVQFLSGALTCWRYEPRLLPAWTAYLLAPLVASSAVALLASSWTHGLSNSTQLLLAILGALLVGATVLAINPSTRDWARHNLPLKQ